MDAREALLAALHADPADHVARLALADWLDENGEAARAELLRLHHSLPHLAAGKARLAVERRIQKLLASGVRPCVPELTNSLGMRLALIPAGTFQMGSPPRETRRMDDEWLHPVRLTRPFYLGVFAVTQEEYEAVTRNKPSDCTHGARLPVEQVSWEDAVEFCSRLSKRAAEKKARRTYRLPTEAEWEYACRAWGSPNFAFHLGRTLRHEQANFESEYPYPPADREKHAGESLRRPCAVGEYAPNAFGLFDMHGNVDEWVNDYYDENYYPVSPEDDPPGPEEGNERVVRGGSWSGHGTDCRAAIRIGYGEDDEDNEIGFRVAMTVGAP